jgi:hypothetical protein
MVCEVDYNDACLGDKLGGSHGSIKINAAAKREIRIRIGNFIDANDLVPQNSKDNKDNKDNKNITAL